MTRSISFVVVTYNSGDIIQDCLQSIVTQKYPNDKMEIIVVDGGSKDSTVEIARKYGAKVIFENTGRPELATGIGFFEAKNELVANVASDNILPNDHWIGEMVKPFDENDEIVATQPLRYTYVRSASLLNRYFSLFGVNDPLPYYLNKRDRLSFAENTWSLPGRAKDLGDFFLVKYSPKNVPTLGANGFIIRRKVLVESKFKASDFTHHMDVCYELIKKGYDTFGIVKTHIIHQTGYDFLSYFRRRIRYMRLYFADISQRKYHVYTKTEKKNLLRFLFYTVTFVKPAFDGIKGYKKIKDVAWFLNPIFCFVTMLVYASVYSLHGLKIL